jgi:hypothetical protein
MKKTFREVAQRGVKLVGGVVEWGPFLLLLKTSITADSYSFQVLITRAQSRKRSSILGGCTGLAYATDGMVKC